MGRLKKWLFFYNRQANSFIGKEHEILAVLCAALNKFNVPLAKDKPAHKQMALKMLEAAKHKVLNPSCFS